MYCSGVWKSLPTSCQEKNNSFFPFIYRSFIDRTGALTTPLPRAVLLRAEELLNHVVCVVVAISHLLFSSFRFIDQTGAFFPEHGRTLIAAQYCRYCCQSNLPVWQAIARYLSLHFVLSCQCAQRILSTQTKYTPWIDDNWQLNWPKLFNKVKAWQKDLFRFLPAGQGDIWSVVLSAFT